MAKQGPISSKLVKLAAKGQYGHRRTPRGFYMGNPDVEGKDSLYCEYYWSWAKWDMTFEEYVKVARLSNRYRRLVRYLEEVKPEWKVVEEIHFADNSVEHVQRANDGRIRQVMVKAPSGDACF